MITKVHNLWKKFSSREYRESFMEAHISSTVAAQIHTIRQDRGWSQSELAEKAGMKQSRISVLEDPDNVSISIATLRRIAAAFDVALIVRFVPFSELLRWSSDTRNNKFSAPEYSKDSIAEIVGYGTPTVSASTASTPSLKILIGGAVADSVLVENKSTASATTKWTSDARH